MKKLIAAFILLVAAAGGAVVQAAQHPIFCSPGVQCVLGVSQTYDGVTDPLGQIFSKINLDLTPLPAYLGEVATNTTLPNAQMGGNVQSMNRTGHHALSDISQLQIVYPNFFLTGAAEVGTGTATITASIEYPVGVITQAIFPPTSAGSGGVTGTIAAAGMITTLPINISIPKGALFFVRTWMANASGVPLISNQSTSSTDQSSLFSGSTTPDLTLGGAVGNTAAGTTYTPAAIIAVTTAQSVAFIGDSRTTGNADSFSGYYGSGELAKAFDGPNGATVAYTAFDAAGGEMVNFAQANTYFNSKKLLNFYTNIIIQYGTNDMQLGTRTAVQVLADAQTIRALFPSRTWLICTVAPRTTDATNVTPVTGFAQTEAYNASLRAAVPAGFAKVLDIATVVENGTTGLWKSASLTSDGTHETPAGYLLEYTSGAVHL